MDISTINNYLKTSWLWWLFGSRELKMDIESYNRQTSDYYSRSICCRIEYALKNRPFSFSDWVLNDIYQSFTTNEMYQKYLLIPDDLRSFKNRSQGHNPVALEREYEFFHRELHNTANMDEARRLAQQMSMLHQYGYRLSSDNLIRPPYHSVLRLPTQFSPFTFHVPLGYRQLYCDFDFQKEPAMHQLQEQLAKILEIIKKEKNIGELRIVIPDSDLIICGDMVPKEDFISMQNQLVEALLYRKKHLSQTNNHIIIDGGIESPSLDILHAMSQEPRDKPAIAGYLALKKIPSVSLKQGSMFVNKRNHNPILPPELIDYICSYLSVPLSSTSVMHVFLILFPIPKKYLDMRKYVHADRLNNASIESGQETGVDMQTHHHSKSR